MRRCVWQIQSFSNVDVKPLFSSTCQQDNQRELAFSLNTSSIQALMLLFAFLAAK